MDKTHQEALDILPIIEGLNVSLPEDLETIIEIEAEYCDQEYAEVTAAVNAKLGKGAEDGVLDQQTLIDMALDYTLEFAYRNTAMHAMDPTVENFEALKDVMKETDNDLASNIVNKAMESVKDGLDVVTQYLDEGFSTQDFFDQIQSREDSSEVFAYLSKQVKTIRVATQLIQNIYVDDDEGHGLKTLIELVEDDDADVGIKYIAMEHISNASPDSLMLIKRDLQELVEESTHGSVKDLAQDILDSSLPEDPSLGCTGEFDSFGSEYE